MARRERLSNEAKRLFREYALRVARKEHPNAVIKVRVGDFVEEDGRVERTVTILTRDTEADCS